METKIFRKIALKLSALGLGFIAFLSNPKNIRAEGWQMPTQPVGGVPVDYETAATIAVKNYVMVPFFFIGGAIYVLVFIYKMQRRDAGLLKNLRKAGTACLVMATILLASLILVVPNFYKYNNLVIMLLTVGFYLVLLMSGLILIMTIVYVLQYIRSISGKNKPIPKINNQKERDKQV